MPELRAASERDWQIFTRLAKAEGWRVPQLELRMLQGDWADAVQVLGFEEMFCGLVSALCHGRSGWIGNLLVPPRLRRRGYGQRLFEAALELLDGQGVESVWLTASAQGLPLYRRYGFDRIGDIERWVLPSGGASRCIVDDSSSAWVKLRQADRLVWSESRERLLEGLAPGARAFACSDAVALLQVDTVLQILGPWYAPNACPRSNRQLLQSVLAARHPARELVADILADSPLKPLLVAAGFACQGEAALMVRGEHPGVELTSMVSLASLGSIG